VIARVFAGFEGILTLGVAAGASLAPVVIELLGIRGALVALGLVGPVSVAVAWPALRRLDARMRARDADIRLQQTAVPSHVAGAAAGERAVAPRPQALDRMGALDGARA
jgi:hypothetical protein